MLAISISNMEEMPLLRMSSSITFIPTISMIINKKHFALDLKNLIQRKEYRNSTYRSKTQFQSLISGSSKRNKSGTQKLQTSFKLYLSKKGINMPNYKPEFLLVLLGIKLKDLKSFKEDRINSLLRKLITHSLLTTWEWKEYASWTLIKIMLEKV